jgi:hypothetical protein
VGEQMATVSRPPWASTTVLDEGEKAVVLSTALLALVSLVRLNNAEDCKKKISHSRLDT